MSISNYNNNLFHKVDLSLLKYFYDVATHGGFTKASRATGVSQPALSLGLQKLEKALGVKLIRRGGGQFGLTEEGRELLQFCDRFESGLQSVVESFGAESTQARLLRIGTALSVGFGPLIPLCQRAAKTERPISIEMVTQNSYDLLRSLSDFQLDAALVPDDIHDSGLNFTRIHQDQLTFIAGAKSASLLSSQNWMEAVTNLTLVTFPRETPMRSMIDKIVRDRRLHFARIVSVNSVEALKMLVARGIGGAFVLRSLVLNELRSGVLIEPKHNTIRVKSGVSLAVRNDERGSEVAKLVLELLKP
jgi:DNA-binding transcriptional LysR family regulator